MIKRIVFAGLASLGLTAPVAAGDVDFSGKTIEMIIPYGPGGGSSTHGRIIAALLEKELPGNPTVIIKNIEGGGSVRGINQFQRRAEPDGMTLASVGLGTYFGQMLNKPEVKYDLRDMIPILSSAYGIVVYGRTDFGLTGEASHDIPHLQKNVATWLGDGAANADLPAMFCLDQIGIDVNAVWGVSRGESRQAFERGESQLNYDNLSSWNSKLKPMMDSGLMVPVFTLGYQKSDGSVTRDPNLPDTATCPELYEMVHGKPMSGTEKEIYDALFAIRMTASKTILLPAGTPDDIVQTYRDAMARAMARPEIVNDPKVRLQLGGYDQAVHQDTVRAHKMASQISSGASAALAAWLNEKWGIKLPKS